MFDIRIVFSLCFLFAAIILNGLTIINIARLNIGPDKRKNLYALALILMSHSLYVYVAILIWSDWKFVDVGAPFALLYGPLLWHLTQISRKKDHQLQNLKWHLIPFIAFAVVYVYCLNCPNNISLIKYYTNSLYITAGIQFTVYLILSIVAMKRIKSQDKEAYQAKITFFNYLYLLSAIAIFLFLTTTLDRLFNIKDQSEKTQWSYFIHLLILGLSILLHLGLVKEWQFIGLKNALKPLEDQINEKETTKEKYQTTLKKRSYLETISGKIEKTPPEIYRNPELNLGEFAKIINEEPHLITQTFSIKLNTNFNKFTNQKRLEFSAHLLLSPETSQLSIADIAYQSGFNSEASFYRVFREHFQTTPRAFQKENLLKIKDKSKDTTHP